MILNEKGLLRAMKESYKTGGYTAVSFYTNDREPWIAIYDGNLWLAEAHKDFIPRKILGLIAEHAGHIPVVGEGVTLVKDTVQDMIWSTAMEPVVCCNEAAQSAEVLVKRTELTYKGAEVWQMPRSGVITYAQPDRMSIGTFGSSGALMVDEALYISGFSSRLFVRCYTPGPMSGDRAAEFLAKQEWVTE